MSTQKHPEANRREIADGLTEITFDNRPTEYQIEDFPIRLKDRQEATKLNQRIQSIDPNSDKHFILTKVKYEDPQKIVLIFQEEP